MQEDDPLIFRRPKGCARKSGWAASASGAPDVVGRAARGASQAASQVASQVAAALLAEQERWVLWLPVLVGIGIALYFSLPDEPPVALGGGILAAGLLTTALCASRRHRRPLLWLAAVAVAAVAAGFCAAQLQATTPETRTLAAPLGPATLGGRVVAVERFPDGQRLMLDRLAVAGMAADALPARARLRLRGAQPTVRPGDEIGVRAMLVPPPPPVIPGAYDYQRQAWFEGIGAVGYSVGRVAVQTASARAEEGGLALWFARTRFAVGERVRETLRGACGAVTVALLIGEKRGVPDADMAAIRNSGLAHLLSISGLHIGLVAAIVLVVVRGGLALVPAVALRWPVKKGAAVVSVAAAGAYTLLADAPVPSQRSFLMIAVVLLATLVDRQGVSMRLIAFAAMVVLLTQPVAMLGPSFQMSFAAVVALLAAWEVIKRRRLSRPAETGGIAHGRLVLYVGGVLLTTAVATLATTPYAIYHFDRVQVYGLAANLLAVPLTSFWIMPWAVLAMLLMPFGLDPVALVPMGWGVDGVLWIAHRVASWPGSVVLLPQLPTWGLALITLGGAWLCLWQGRWRLIGLVAVVVGGTALLRPSPDLFVDGAAQVMAVRDGDGRILFSLKSAGRTTRDAWLRRVGASRPPGFWPEAGASEGGLLRCDGLGCVFRDRGHVVAIARRADALDEDCRHADVVVSAVPVQGACPSAKVVIDRAALAHGGAHALWLGEDGVRIENVGAGRGRRPWVVPPSSGPAARGSAGSSRPAAPREAAASEAAPDDTAPGEAAPAAAAAAGSGAAAAAAAGSGEAAAADDD